jgi:hypothetical protein
MLLRRPALMQADAQHVRDRANDIASMVGLETADAAVLLARQPLLLDLPPTSLAGQLAGLAAGLGVGLPATLMLLSRLDAQRAVALLQQQPEQLAGQLGTLGDVLGGYVGRESAAAVQLFVLRCPRLLLTPPADVDATLDTLRKALRLSPRRLLRLLAK